MINNMQQIVICPSCRDYEYYGKLRYLEGDSVCRSCYRRAWEHSHKKIYAWSDLDGPTPSQEDYKKQQEKENEQDG